MSELVDRECSRLALTSPMPPTGTHNPSRDADFEREYVDHRSAVLAMLASNFPHFADREEIYHEAWIEFLELERRGEHVEHRRALLKKIAWRRAADATKRRRPETIDPASAAFSVLSDDEPLPDEQAQLRLDGEALRVVVESLDEQQAAVLKMRFDQHLSAREIQTRMGISEKRLEAIVTAAYKKVAAQIEPDAGGVATWSRRQRSLLLACELGIATTRQRRRAQAMVDRDPHCRAMLRAMRSGLGDVAAVLPMPVLVHEQERLRGIARMPHRLDEILATGRHLADKLSGRGVVESGALEQAGVGGATVGTGAVAAKVVALCLAAGGTAALCVTTGAGLLGTQPVRSKPPVAQPSHRVVEPPREHVEVVRLPKITTTASQKTKSTKESKHETPVSSTKSKPPASPAPKGGTEFGPGALGSTSAPKQPAAAPQNGGGEFTP
jgi:RNA polymerase sigma factor (sigma-70 family)